MVTSSVLLTLLAVCALGAADRVAFEPCQGGMKKCTVNWVDISPCPEAASGDPCRTKKGKNSGIVFNYTPEIAKDNLDVKVYWASATGDLPFAGLDPDACAVTQCPVTANQAQNLTYSLNVPKKTSPRIYNIKWDLHDENKELQCCFLTKIRIV